MEIELNIRKTSLSDYSKIIDIEKTAFDGDEVAELTAQLLNDKSAKPYISLLAFYKKEAIGHILFTKASIKNTSLSPKAYILAPLAVIPEYQNQGVGGKLINEGFNRLKIWGVDIVFVLGHIEYYPKFGFIKNAEKLGFPAPYTIPDKVADAWMVKSLTSQNINICKGQVVCADAMNKPEHWRE